MTADRWFILLGLMWMTWMAALFFVPGINPNLSGAARTKVTFKTVPAASTPPSASATTTTPTTGGGAQ